jgi:predicted DNA-binding protein YlxM (UPF0122 family)
MANVKFSATDWERAKEYFEAGLSLSKISDKLGIDKGAISRKAKSDSWVKNNDQKQQLILDGTKVQVAKSSLNKQALSVHDELVNEHARDLIFYNKTQNRFAQIAKEIIENKHAEKELSVMELAGASRVVKDSREGVIGKAPETVINNTNAQQNISMTAEEIRRISQALRNEY